MGLLRRVRGMGRCRRCRRDILEGKSRAGRRGKVGSGVGRVEMGASMDLGRLRTVTAGGGGGGRPRGGM